MSDLLNYKHGHRECDVRFMHQFDYVGHNGWGFGFDCDEDGTVHNMHPAAQVNYDLCISGTMDPPVVDKGIVRLENSYWVEPHGTCPECGNTVYIYDGLGVQCDCGACYDYGGSRVKYVTREGFEAAGGWTVAGEYWDGEDY